MELPAGYRLWAPALGDLGAVADVLVADERAGMRIINRWDVWERSLGNSRGS